MTEQDYRTTDTGIPTQPATLPAMPTVAPTAVQPLATPVPAPVAAPVATPVAAPVATPVAEPAEAPAAEPVAEPVAEPKVAVDEDVAPAKPATRPASASHRSRRPAGGAKKVTRYTLDLETEMHRGLRLYAVSQDVDASKVMRALLWLLMANQELPAGVTLSDLVLDEIFGAEDE